MALLVGVAGFVELDASPWMLQRGRGNQRPPHLGGCDSFFWQPLCCNL